MVDLEGHDRLPESELTFVTEDDWIVAHHEPSGVASQGKTRDEAHAMISEAVLLYRGVIGDPIESWAAEKELLKDIGLTEQELTDIKTKRETDSQSLPDFME